MDQLEVLVTENKLLKDNFKNISSKYQKELEMKN